MKKITVSLVSVAVMVIFGMTGCGEGSGSDNPTDGKGGLKLLSYQEYYYNSEGKKEERENITFSYDEEGRLARWQEDGHAIGYEYDEKGRNISRYYVSHPEFKTVFTYDDAGNVIKDLFSGYDERGGGYYDSMTIYKYDTSIILPRKATIAHRWIADARSPLVKKLEDSDGDGTYDKIITYTNNEHGDHITWKSKSITRHETYISNGKVEYTYQNGHITTERIDIAFQVLYTDRNTSWEDIYMIHYSYDDNGNKILAETDVKNDGTVDETKKYTYDEHGNLERIESLNEKGDLWYEVLYTWGTPEENEQESLPDFYGYDTITIYTHLKKGTQLYEQYSQMGIAGTEKAYYHGVASCQDYGFLDRDQQSSNVSADVRITIYYDGSSSCTQTELLPDHAMYGDESILFGRP